MDGSANGAKDEYEEGEYVDDDVTNDSVQQERSYESKQESSSPPVRSRPAAEKRRELPFGVSRHYADDSQQQRPRAKSRERDKERQSRKHKRKNKDKSKSRSRLSPVCWYACQLVQVLSMYIASAFTRRSALVPLLTVDI